MTKKILPIRSIMPVGRLPKPPAPTQRAITIEELFILFAGAREDAQRGESTFEDALFERAQDMLMAAEEQAA